MNILVIGNGFDLAHGLPTKYTDFLEWITKYQQFYSYSTRKRAAGYRETNDSILKYFNKLFYDNMNKDICDEIYRLVYDNIWIQYFQQCKMYKKENWIDFESEISEVIQLFDKEMHKHSENDTFREAINDYHMEFYCKRGRKDIIAIQSIIRNLPEEITFKEIRNRFLDDLNRLIRVLEIYLCDYAEKLVIEKKSPDIQGLEVDFILSFNYTHIFSKLYSVSSQSKKEIADPFDYLHGEAKINNTIETNNMVLGIDEYLPKKRKNEETEFIAFKKFYQRIYKQTGNEYKRWVEIIKNHMQEIDDKIKKQYPVQIPYNKIPNKCRNQLFIFGHSLDITDKDVLREMILNDNVYTTIYYPDKKELGRKIANLVKIIGQDELIRRTGGNTKTIQFVLQKPMEKIKDS
ncbi:AbiH family protein [Candidatus Merdisoma sp. JLR.KK011]|uniref:AbiH family protein n=1 Tax=Candidatus Merdisoma sp. JLR.KK011 TaxID=3114299 RepID=UPI002FEFDFE9